jgi:hypothetical protein
MRKSKYYILTFLALLLLFPSFLFNYSYNKKIYGRRALWSGEAVTYGAPSVNLLVDFVNECHYRMRFYYYMGVAPKSVIFGRYLKIKNGIILIDGEGNSVKFLRRGNVIKGHDNGYRILLKKIR